MRRRKRTVSASATGLRGIDRADLTMPEVCRSPPKSPPRGSRGPRDLCRERRACRSQPHGAGRPDHQLHPEVVLEIADRAAHGAVGHAELLGGPGKAEVAGRGLEARECIEWRQTAWHGRNRFVSDAHRSSPHFSFVIAGAAEPLVSEWWPASQLRRILAGAFCAARPHHDAPDVRQDRRVLRRADARDGDATTRSTSGSTTTTGRPSRKPSRFRRSTTRRRAAPSTSPSGARRSGCSTSPTSSSPGREKRSARRGGSRPGGRARRADENQSFDDEAAPSI